MLVNQHRNTARGDCLEARTSHKLLTVDLVCFVEDATDLVLVSFECVDGTLELIGNIQLVSIEQQDDQIGSLRNTESE